MVLATHFVVASVGALFTKNPLLLVLFGVVSHFALDMVPHWQYELKIKNQKSKIKIWEFTATAAAKGLIDLGIGAALVVTALVVKYGVVALDISNWELGILPYLFAGFWGCVPDMAWFLAHVFPQNALFQKYSLHHERINSKVELKHPIHAVWQVLLIALALILLAF